MTNTFWESVANTPWWVFLLFFYLVRVGIVATKARVISIKKFMFLPIILISISVYGLYALVEWNLNIILMGFLAILTGILLGWLQFRTLKIKVIQNTDTLYVPGTWSLLIIILSIFTFKYYSGYELVLDAETFKQPQYATGLFMIYSLFIGLFIGRLIFALKCLKVGPFIAEPLIKQV